VPSFKFEKIVPVVITLKNPNYVRIYGANVDWFLEEFRAQHLYYDVVDKVSGAVTKKSDGIYKVTNPLGVTSLNKTPKIYCKWEVMQFSKKSGKSVYRQVHEEVSDEDMPMTPVLQEYLTGQRDTTYYTGEGVVAEDNAKKIANKHQLRCKSPYLNERLLDYEKFEYRGLLLISMKNETDFFRPTQWFRFAQGVRTLELAPRYKKYFTGSILVLKGMYVRKESIMCIFSKRADHHLNGSPKTKFVDVYSTLPTSSVVSKENGYSNADAMKNSRATNIIPGTGDGEKFMDVSCLIPDFLAPGHYSVHLDNAADEDLEVPYYDKEKLKKQSGRGGYVGKKRIELQTKDFLDAIPIIIAPTPVIAQATPKIYPVGSSMPIVLTANNLGLTLSETSDPKCVYTSAIPKDEDEDAEEDVKTTETATTTAKKVNYADRPWSKSGAMLQCMMQHSELTISPLNSSLPAWTAASFRSSDANGNARFNLNAQIAGVPYDKNRIFGIGIGDYTLKNIPKEHPIAIITSSRAVSYTGDPAKKLVKNVNSNMYSFYWGDVTIKVT
jgi:hypothetical protein